MKRRVASLLLTIAILFFGATLSSGIAQHQRSSSIDGTQIVNASSLGGNNQIQPASYSNGIIFDQSTTMLSGNYDFSGPFIIPSGVTVIGDPGQIHIQATDVLIDGAYVCGTQFTGGGQGGNANQNGADGSGTGGGNRGISDGGGGGGASYGSPGNDGTSGVGNGGQKGSFYGYAGLAPGNFIPSGADIQMGSVGGGGAGGDGPSGGNGGAGGGSVFFEGTNSVTVTGSISCNGANGQNGDDDVDDASGGGGGGSGGGVLVYGYDVTISGAISVAGGPSGQGGSTTFLGTDGGDGGNGGLGRVKIFYQNSYSKTVTPTGVLHEEQIIIPKVNLKVPHFNQLYKANEAVELNITNSNGTFEYAWDSNSFTTVTDGFTPMTPTTDGPHDLHVKLYSSTLHLEQKTFPINVDGTAPLVTTNSSSVVEYVEGTTSHQLFFTLSDTNPGLFNLTLDGGFIFTNEVWVNDTIVGEYGGLSVGLHTVELSVGDVVWNVATLSVSINVTGIPTSITATTSETTTSTTSSTSTSTSSNGESTTTSSSNSSSSTGPASPLNFPFYSLIGFSTVLIVIKRKLK